MNLSAVVARYKRFNPDTGAFDCPRGLREYARLLDVDAGQLSRIIRGANPPGRIVLERLSRTFPQSANEIAAALQQPADEPTAVSA